MGCTIEKEVEAKDALRVIRELDSILDCTNTARGILDSYLTALEYISAKEDTVSSHNLLGREGYTIPDSCDGTTVATSNVFSNM